MILLISSLLEVLLGFRFYEVALVYDMSKAYQSIATERHVRRIVWRWSIADSEWEIYGYEVVTFGDQVAGLVSVSYTHLTLPTNREV